MKQPSKISLTDKIEQYLKKEGYAIVPIKSCGINMVAMSDALHLCLYTVLKDEDDADQAVANAANQLCKFRDYITQILTNTLEDILLDISMHIFSVNKKDISPKNRRSLHYKGIQCQRLSTLKKIFPSFKNSSDYDAENYEAYVEYLNTVAHYIIADAEPIKYTVDDSASAPSIPADGAFSSPRALANEVKKYVKGQDAVIDSIAIPFFQHVESMRNGTTCDIKNSFVIVGNTGTGKSEILRRFAQLCDVPIIRINMADCTPSAWKGQHIQDHIGFYINSLEDLERMRYAVIVFNEFDKITHYNTRAVGSNSSDWDMDIQRELLRFYDKGYELLIERHDSSFQTETYRLPTENFLLCFDGAFSGIDKIIERRVGSAKVGYSAAPGLQKMPGDLSQLKSEDLEKWGYIPELLGRIGSFFVMNPMSVDLMVEVMTTASENILEAHVKQCAQYGIDLSFETDALRHIAQKAMDMKLGFRAIKPILNKLLQAIYFDCDKHRGRKLAVDMAFINSHEC